MVWIFSLRCSESLRIWSRSTRDFLRFKPSRIWSGFSVMNLMSIMKLYLSLGVCRIPDELRIKN